MANLADRRWQERALLDEAQRRQSLTDDRDMIWSRSIPIALGDELIDAARELVAAAHAHDSRRQYHAICWLERLVGRP